MARLRVGAVTAARRAAESVVIPAMAEQLHAAATAAVVPAAIAADVPAASVAAMQVASVAAMQVASVADAAEALAAAAAVVTGNFSSLSSARLYRQAGFFVSSHNKYTTGAPSIQRTIK
jgi:hypothetical protein